MSFLKKILCIFLVLTVFASCSKKTDEEKFRENLAAIDSYIAEGKNYKAVKKLNRLQKKAKHYKDYASLVKRLLNLDAPNDAIFILQKGLEKLPDSSHLSAMLTSILIENGKAGEAVPYAENLKDSVYAGLAAEACVIADMEKDSFTCDFSLLKSAFDLTDKQDFLRNAALNLASRGRLKEAADLRDKLSDETIPDDPYFWSCLAFDIGRFSPIFSDLFFSLALSDKAGGVGKPADSAARHLMLAADAAYGQSDTERARAFWIAAADRTPERNPVVFYDLALTAPDDNERVDLLMECIDLFPDYYPVIAQYAREYMALRQAAPPDDISKYLEERGFYSLGMERLYFASPKMTYTPEELFAKAFACENPDIRFVLEDFRYEQLKDNSSNALSRGKGKMWNILEKFANAAAVKEYAKWYFSRVRDFNACFSVADIGSSPDDDFYKGLSAALAGELDSALEFFSSAVLNHKNAFAATANMGLIYKMQGKIETAIRTLSLADSLCNDSGKKSRLQYDIALIYYERKLIESAINSLEYALDLNSKNYKAEILLKRLKQAK